jgi:RNA polymerase sigma-70 factor (ECF subfamily)
MRANCLMAAPELLVHPGPSRGEASVNVAKVSAADEPDRPFDSESQRWIDELSSAGPVREAAIARLHDLLLRAAYSELARRAASTDISKIGERDELAMQAANDALVAILAKLDDFRGRSRFTTWAYKFALLETGVKLRRKSWHDRELPLEEDGLQRLAEASADPTAQTETSELMTAIGRAIHTDLTPHQRTVIVALALNDVPIDVLAERMGTTRGALYKTLHDARQRLRAQLEAQGLMPELEGSQ